jgi:hypothetical protein
VKYRNLSIVIIDEISMVGKKMFSFLDTRLKKIKGNIQSFGDVSILAVEFLSVCLKVLQNLSHLFDA